MQNVRQIVDAVKPKRTFYTLETMPWVIPDSPDSYLKLIEADALDYKIFLQELSRLFQNVPLILERLPQ